MSKNQSHKDKYNDETYQKAAITTEPDVTSQVHVSQDAMVLLEDQLKRLAAEFANYRRRTEEERKQIVQFAQARTLLELTPVLDNFRRATDHLPADLRDNNWVTGVLYVEKQLEQILQQFGLERIKTVGEMFDPERHEAVSTDNQADIPKNQIIAEIESGYTLNSQVLKPAKVKVSSGPRLLTKM